MAGSSVTQTVESRGPVGVITLTATGDDADGSFPETVLTPKISGRLLALETNPGSPAPTTNYDIVLDDAEGHDVLEGVGGNLSATLTEKSAVVNSGTDVNPAVAKSDALTLKITGNVVNSAILVAKIYFLGEAEGGD